MKRLHVHVGVEDLDQSIVFHSALLAAAPIVVKDDHARRMLDDPRLNFAEAYHAAELRIERLPALPLDGIDAATLASRLREIGRTSDADAALA